MQSQRYKEYAHMAIKYKQEDLDKLFYVFIRDFDKEERNEAIERFHLLQMVAQNARQLSDDMIKELDAINP